MKANVSTVVGGPEAEIVHEKVPLPDAGVVRKQEEENPDEEHP